MNQPPRHAVGCVSFLNARPLIEGLDGRDDIEVRYDVPSRLIEDLERGEVDIALCPVIDYQRAGVELELVPVGGIGCDGPTLTVRLFSRIPIPQITRVLTDTDSHSSVILLRVILADQYGIQPEIAPLPVESTWRDSAEAVLLIGDKVVSRAPDEAVYPHQLDLGEAWKKLTGLPFVFAIWMARRGASLGALPQTLWHAQHSNAFRIDEIVTRHAAVLGWPADLAAHYLGDLLHYTIGPPQLQAVELFWQRAHALGQIPQLRPLRCSQPVGQAES
ncbi:menaquinone biosynthesis protein [Planctomycetales bacterium ZRK34]|nr:menaquinone biosynthesis protein [Planctomycetales bacterium ZRK34]